MANPPLAPLPLSTLHLSGAGGARASDADIEVNPFGPNGIFTIMAENIPIVNAGIQRLHALMGEDAALERAKQQDPMGPDGYITQAAEYIPGINSVVQDLHRSSGEESARLRASVRDPIGSQGYLTQALEQLPILSDGMLALHRARGDDLAAERARAKSMERILGKDGPLTRLAELLPVSNLLAAAVHKLNGNDREALRALDLVASWGEISAPDGPVWQVAELLPGADAVAFAAHMQGGFYAQALRSITKTSYVNVAIDKVLLTLRLHRLGHLSVLDIEIGMIDVIPRQPSLVVGMADLLLNFVWLDRQGQLRGRGFNPTQPFTGPGALELTKEMLKILITQGLNRRVTGFQETIPDQLEWLVDTISFYLPLWKSNNFGLRVICPDVLPSLPDAVVEAAQRALPVVSTFSSSLPAPEKIPLKPVNRLAIARTVAAASCLSAAGCTLGVKTGLLGCAVGALAGLGQLGRMVTRRAVDWVNDRNSQRWRSSVVEPQPPLPKVSFPDQTPVQLTPLPTPRGSAPAASPESVASSVQTSPRTSQMFTSQDEDSRREGEGMEGMVCEMDQRDAIKLGPVMRKWFLKEVIPQRRHVGRLCAWAMTTFEPLVWRLASQVADVDGLEVPVVVDIECEDFDVSFEGVSFRFRMPAMRMALVLYVQMQRGSPKTRRVQLVLPPQLLDNLLTAAREQLGTWDLRELDARLSTFTRPAQAQVESLDFMWVSRDTLCLEIGGISARLDLPG